MLNSLFSKQKTLCSSIKIETIPIGGIKINVPVADLWGSEQGETLLITAGFDGDEYAGIEAAYRLIQTYEKTPFIGHLIIIPVFNTLGFEHEVSWNPLDGRYPKHVFPGKKDGGPTEELVYWFSENILPKASTWVDLHGGSLVEVMRSFVLSYETKSKEINKKTQLFLDAIKTEIKIYQTNGHKTKAQKLAQDEINYLMFESGEASRRSQKDCDRHIAWIESVMGVLGMVEQKNKIKKNRYINQVHEYYASKHGLWYPSFTGKIKQGQIIGRLFSSEGKQIQIVAARRDGLFLWGKTGMRAKIGDVLAVVGC